MFIDRDISARVIAASFAAVVGLGMSAPARAAVQQAELSRTSQATSHRNATGATESVLYSFAGPDGANPQGALLDDPLTSTIYGTTQDGGANGDGNIFSLNTSTLAFTSFFSFSGANGATPSGGGANPFGDYIFTNPAFGVTTSGGAHGFGEIFEATNNGAEVVLYSFTGGADGANPVGRLVYYNGVYYGTTSAGAAGFGTVFSYKPGSGLKTIHTFADGNDGATPLTGLALQLHFSTTAAAIRAGAVAGHSIDATRANSASVTPALFGTTSTGGNAGLGAGTLFAITPSGQFLTLYTFADTPANPGASPQAELVSDAVGNFYGTTYTGGTAGLGEVFELTAKGTFKVLQDLPFNSATGSAPLGANPAAPLTVSIFGNLYGTTSAGSANGLGNVFEIPNGKPFELRYEFSGPDGANPEGKLVDALTGQLYGTTNAGGANGLGSVYSIPE